MLRRVHEHGNPAVILYVSDYDDAGQNMPVQVSRHCQFAAWELEELAYEVAPEIRVDSVALTADLVEELDLPPIPGTSKREIDALEALYPGKLEEVLAERVEELQDRTLRRRVLHAERSAREAVEGEIKGVLEDHEARLEEIRQEAQGIVSRYRRYYEILGEQVAQRYEKLSQRYERHVEELRSEHEDIKRQVREGVEGLEVDLPELPEPENGLPERDWLYNSRRHFLDQTDRLRDFKP
jgi:hypothetical protein